MAGFLKSLTERLTRTSADLDAHDLREHVGRVGATPCALVQDRSVVDVSGVLRSVTLPPKGHVPALVAELYDGSAEVNLIWLGRREIGGIVPGAYVRARGRVCYQRGIPIVYNPAYELLPPKAR